MLDACVSWESVKLSHPLGKDLGDVMGQALGCARSTRGGGVSTKNGKNNWEIRKKMQDQEEEELDSLAIATQIIPIANTPRSNNNKRKDTKVVPTNQ